MYIIYIFVSLPYIYDDWLRNLCQYLKSVIECNWGSSIFIWSVMSEPYDSMTSLIVEKEMKSKNRNYSKYQLTWRRPRAFQHCDFDFVKGDLRDNLINYDRLIICLLVSIENLFYLKMSYKIYIVSILLFV